MTKWFDFFKKKEVQFTEKEWIRLTELSSFTYTMGYVKDIISRSCDEKEKIMILEYIIDVIKRDLQIQGLKEVIYKKEDRKHKKVPSPLYYIHLKDANGKISDEMLGLEKENNIIIDLEKDLVITCPWHRDRLLNTLNMIWKNDFVYKDNNHHAYYYTLLDICSVYNGFHSITSGIYHKKGQIEATVVNTKVILENVYTTNGIHWYNKKNDKKVGQVTDFRAGALLEILRIKLELENCIK